MVGASAGLRPRARAVDRFALGWWTAIASVCFLVASELVSLLDASVANSGTVLGALCFFWGARLLLLVPDAEPPPVPA